MIGTGVEICSECIDGKRQCSWFDVNTGGISLGSPLAYTTATFRYWDGQVSGKQPDYSTFVGRGRLYSASGSLIKGGSLPGSTLIMGEHEISLKGELRGLAFNLDILFLGWSNYKYINDDGSPFTWEEDCSCFLKAWE